jgi:hypothetical protein
MRHGDNAGCKEGVAETSTKSVCRSWSYSALGRGPGPMLRLDNVFKGKEEAAVSMTVPAIRKAAPRSQLCDTPSSKMLVLAAPDRRMLAVVLKAVAVTEDMC